MYQINKTGQRVEELLDMIEGMDYVPMTEQDAADMVQEIFGTNSNN